MAKKKAGGENEHHVVGVRLRVVGQGWLDLQLSDLDDTRIHPMEPILMFTTARIEPTRLANFQSQRIRLTCKVTEIGENFHIRRIIIFAKPVAIEYPG